MDAMYHDWLVEIVQKMAKEVPAYGMNSDKFPENLRLIPGGDYDAESWRVRGHGWWEGIVNGWYEAGF